MSRSHSYILSSLIKLIIRIFLVPKTKQFSGHDLTGLLLIKKETRLNFLLKPNGCFREIGGTLDVKLAVLRTYHESQILFCTVANLTLV